MAVYGCLVNGVFYRGTCNKQPRNLETLKSNIPTEGRYRGPLAVPSGVRTQATNRPDTYFRREPPKHTTSLALEKLSPTDLVASNFYNFIARQGKRNSYVYNVREVLRPGNFHASLFFAPAPRSVKSSRETRPRALAISKTSKLFVPFGDPLLVDMKLR